MQSPFEKVGRREGPGAGKLMPHDPKGDLQEIERRMEMYAGRDVATETVQMTHATSETASLHDFRQKRAQFENANSGFYVVNFANEEFINKCMVPNFEVLEFVRASSVSDTDMMAAHAAAQRVCERFLADPDVRSVPVVIPANRPTLIAHSVDSMQAPAHVLPKIERNITRHNKFTQLAKKEYDLHTKYRIPGFTKVSQYHRHKVYLSTKRTLSFSGKGHDEVYAADALRQYARDGRQALCELEEYVTSKTKEMESKDDEASVPDMHNDGVAEAPETKDSGAATGLDTEGKASEHVASAKTSFIERVFQNEDLAPPVIKDEASLDTSKWSSDGTATIETGLPAHLKASGNYINFVMYEDLDSPEDSPLYPKAAGMEWIICLFGGMYTDADTALRMNEEQIAPWAGDVVINTVQANEWLFPTEVDDDQVPQKQRTVDASMQKEFNLIDKQRLHNLQQVKEARELMSSGAVTMRETIVGDDSNLPDDDEVVAHEREPVRIVATEEDGADVIPDV